MTYVKNRLRRTMMFVPGNNPAMIKDAGIYGADSIMLDLEDSVSLTEKDAARMLVYEAIKTVDFGGSEIVVRVNGQDTPFYDEDVKAMVKAGVDVIRLPKTESAAMIQKLVKDIEHWEDEFDGCHRISQGCLKCPRNCNRNAFNDGLGGIWRRLYCRYAYSSLSRWSRIGICA